MDSIIEITKNLETIKNELNIADDKLNKIIKYVECKVCNKTVKNIKSHNKTKQHLKKSLQVNCPEKL